MPSETEKIVPLEYRSRSEDSAVGSSRLVRCTAAVASAAYLVVTGYFLLRSRRTLGGLGDWILSMTAALAGSCYCALISLDVAGRTKPDRTSWARKTGGIIGPAVLFAYAIGIISDVVSDPYAWTWDYVGCFTASMVLVVIGASLFRWGYILPARQRARDGGARKPWRIVL